jgi:hypothetical protein
MLQHFANPTVILWIIAFFTTIGLFFVRHKIETGQWKTHPLGLLFFIFLTGICVLFMVTAPFLFFDIVLFRNPVVYFIFVWFWVIPSMLFVYFIRTARRTPDRRI